MTDDKTKKEDYKNQDESDEEGILGGESSANGQADNQNSNMENSDEEETA